MKKYIVISLLSFAACNSKPLMSGVIVTHVSGRIDTIYTGPITDAWLDNGNLRVNEAGFWGRGYTAACFVDCINGYIPVLKK